jgi:hypothetical protein
VAKQFGKSKVSDEIEAVVDEVAKLLGLKLPKVKK